VHHPPKAVRSNMITNTRLFYFIIFFSIASLLSCSLISCSNTENAAQKSNRDVTSVKNVTKKEIEKKELKKEEQKTQLSQEYTYDATGKTDPFEPLISSSLQVTKPMSSSVQQQKADVPLTPLQKLDLSELSLVAIIASVHGATALIEDSAKNGYIVKEGMLIGKNDGVIKKIYGSSVVVEEKIFDTMGAPETKVSTLTLKKE
jgi:Tfp pilus assembly protein PilP